MECTKCSKDGDLVYMDRCWDEKLGAYVGICPRCRKEEVIGFGKV